MAELFGGLGRRARAMVRAARGRPQMAPHDDRLPALYHAADRSSLEGQGRFLVATAVRLVALVVAAISGAFTLVVGDIDLLGMAALVALVAALMAEVYILSARPHRLWYDGRAAAESAKTLGWRYLVGGLPFPILVGADGRRTDSDEKAADDLFLTRLDDVLTDIGDLDLDVTSDATVTSQITSTMRDHRGEDLPVRKVAYRQHRIQEQREWYIKKAADNRASNNRWSIAVMVFEGGGILAAALKACTIIDFDLVGLVAAAAAVAMAWSQAKQHEALSRAYFLAGQELASIDAKIASDFTEAQWAGFVQDAEEAISREHTLWRASRGVRLRSRPQQSDDTR